MVIKGYTNKLELNYKTNVWVTCVVRVEQVDQSVSVLLPVCQIIISRRHASTCVGGRSSRLLRLRQHGVAPLKPHLAQNEVHAATPHQEPRAEGPWGAQALHGGVCSLSQGPTARWSRPHSVGATCLFRGAKQQHKQTSVNGIIPFVTRQIVDWNIGLEWH